MRTDIVSRVSEVMRNPVSSARRPSESGNTPKAGDKIEISKEAQARLDAANEGGQMIQDMEAEQAFKVQELQQRVQKGEYTLDNNTIDSIVDKIIAIL
jgi:anti-sigma28 factor (negative regulator of flagellin synthesis)